MKILDTTSMTPKLQPIIGFLKKYGIFIAPALLFLFFMFLLIFSYSQSSSKKPNNSLTPAPSTAQSSGEGTNGGAPSEASAEPQTTPGEVMQENEQDMPLWNGEPISDSDFDGLNATKTTLPDGSIQYSYYSDNTTRPDIIIVKSGIDVFQRTPIQADMDPTESTPDFIAHGSAFWGTNVNTYIYLSKGLAYVGDPSTNKVFEQMTFKPTTLQQFMQYDTDMLQSPQRP